MSPSALTSPKKSDTVSALTEAGVKYAINGTSPSIAVDGNPTGLQELDASKITFTRNPNPKTVPEPKAAEIANMSRYVWANINSYCVQRLQSLLLYHLPRPLLMDHHILVRSDLL